MGMQIRMSGVLGMKQPRKLMTTMMANMTQYSPRCMVDIHVASSSGMRLMVTK